MTEFEQLLKDIELGIESYRSVELRTDVVYDLSTILKDMTSNLFFLAKYRTQFHDDFIRIQRSYKGSVAASEIYAKSEVPELYLCRHLMTAGYECVWALRSNISALKKES